MGFFSWLFGESSPSKLPYANQRVWDAYDYPQRAEPDSRKLAELDRLEDEYKRPEEETLRRGNKQLSKPEPTPHPRQKPSFDSTILEAADQESTRRKEAKRHAAESSIRFSLAPDTETRFSIARPDPIELRMGELRALLNRANEGRAFARALVRYVAERCGGNAAVCYKAAGVSRQLYSQIISDPAKSISRRTALQLALGLKLDKTEAAAFIALAGHAVRTDDFEDLAFAYCLEHKLTIFDVNALLDRAGIKPIDIK